MTTTQEEVERLVRDYCKPQTLEELRLAWGWHITALEEIGVKCFNAGRESERERLIKLLYEGEPCRAARRHMDAVLNLQPQQS